MANLPIHNSGGVEMVPRKIEIFSGAVGAREKISAYKMDMYGLVLILAIQKCNKNEPYMKGRRDRYILGNRPKILGGVEPADHQLWGEVSNLPITDSGGVEPPESQL